MPAVSILNTEMKERKKERKKRKKSDKEKKKERRKYNKIRKEQNKTFREKIKTNKKPTPKICTSRKRQPETDFQLRIYMGRRLKNNT